MANKEVYLTQEGLDKLNIELDELKNVRRPEVIQALKEARALGDLSENAEYDAARDEQAKIESRIQELELMIENATIIGNETSDTVVIGSKVTIKYVADGDEDEYMIVGTKEADPFANKISNESPIAQAIIGLKVNDIATVACDAGDYQVQIMKIA